MKLPMSTLEDFSIAEWRPTDEQLDGSMPLAEITQGAVTILF